MQVSISWLKNMLGHSSFEVGKLADNLTSRGLEVESVSPYKEDFPVRVVVGLVEKISSHEDFDHLKICMTKVGPNRRVVLVTAATNVAEGNLVAVALPGVVLPELGKVDKRRFGEIVSNGMLCSQAELGIGEQDDEVFLLDSKAIAGTPLRDHFHFDDKIMDISLLPNRGDCASMLGIARECAAIDGQSLTGIATSKVHIASKTPKFEVFVEPLSLSARYSARLIQNVNPLARTPDWMKERLIKAGMRCIFPTVDVTNYVMLEIGHPLHAFDFDALVEDSGSPPCIGVRQAKPGDKIELLSEQIITTEGFEWLISNNDKPLALAGVKGGRASGVHAQSQNIMLEAAWFDPTQITKTTQFHGLQTEASFRYERGVDPTLTERAMDRASDLIVQIAGGECSVVRTAKGAALPVPTPIGLDLGRLSRCAGCQIERKVCAGILESLQMELTQTQSGFKVIPPSFRFDIKHEHDLIEEVMRCYGLDLLPTKKIVESGSIKDVFNHSVENSIDQLLMGRGYRQTIHFSFSDYQLTQSLLADQNAVELENPLSGEQRQMRTHLAIGLLDCLRVNLAKNPDSVRVFERGRVYRQASIKNANQSGVNEVEQLALLCYGQRQVSHWSDGSGQVDFFDIKADLEAILHTINELSTAELERCNHPLLHPGLSACVLLKKKKIGYVGKLHPSCAAKIKVPVNVWLLWIDLPSLIQPKHIRYQAISRYPGVQRDLSFVLAKDIQAQELTSVIKKSSGPMLRDVEIFDYYQGKGLLENQKALAVRLHLGSFDHTLSEKEVSEVIERVLKACQVQLDALLRNEKLLHTS